VNRAQLQPILSMTSPSAIKTSGKSRSTPSPPPMTPDAASVCIIFVPRYRMLKTTARLSDVSAGARGSGWVMAVSDDVVDMYVHRSDQG
jgi:hypothetical protein